MMVYFSERESGESSCDSEEISSNAWKGILALIVKRSGDGSFGAEYPEFCNDGNFVCGTDIGLFEDAMLAEIPSLAEIPDRNSWTYNNSVLSELRTEDIQLETLDILDVIEFCWKSIGKPITIGNHSYFMHKHLEFDIAAGQDEFRDQIETILRRNEIAYTLTESGKIQRLMSPDLQEALDQVQTNTGDAEFDRLLATAQQKFLNPGLITRREALESLWDAWERLKTLDGQGDKKSKVKAMLDKAAGGEFSKFRSALENEAIELTRIGNLLRIRHSETDQEIIATNEHMDYLFHRLISLIGLILRTR